MLNPFLDEEKQCNDCYVDYPYSNDFETDIYEEDSNIIVEMHLAGVKKEDVHIELFSNNRLKICGTRQEVKKEKKHNFYKKEIDRGKFKEIVELPEEVDPKGVSARMDEGVLYITLPIKRGEKAGSTEIKVK